MKFLNSIFLPKLKKLILINFFVGKLNSEFFQIRSIHIYKQKTSNNY